MSGLLVFAFLAASVLLYLRFPRLPRQPDPQPPTALAEGSTGDPALMLDLIAAMLQAGQPLSSALDILADGVDEATAQDLHRLLQALDLGLGWEEAWQLTGGTTPSKGWTADAGRQPAMRRSGQSRALAELGPALRFIAATGAPSAAVLHSQADALRRRRHTESRRKAAALGVRLVVPLGLCSLPAFVALTAVPLLLSLLPDWP